METENMTGTSLWIIGKKNDDFQNIDSLLPRDLFESIRYLTFEELGSLSVGQKPEVILLVFTGECNKETDFHRLLEKRTPPAHLVVIAEDTTGHLFASLRGMLLYSWFFKTPGSIELKSSLAGALCKSRSRNAPPAVNDSLLEKNNFLHFFQNVPVAALILNERLECVEVNAAFAGITGVSTEKQRGRQLADLMPELAFQLEPGKDALHEKKTPFINVQVSLHKPSQKKKFKHLLGSFFLIHDRDCGSRTMGGYLFDINDYDALLSRLKTFHEEYGNLFEKAPMGIVLMETGGSIRELNFEMARILGGTSPLSLQQPHKKFHQLLKISSGSWEKFISLLNEKGYVENYELRGEGTNGAPLWISMNARIDMQTEGKTPLINAFVSNITERITAEKENAIISSQVDLVNELNDDLTARLPISEIIRKTCDRLREIYRLRFADFYLRHVDGSGKDYLMYQYSNMDSHILSAIEKITGLSLRELRIPLHDESMFNTIYQQGESLELMKDNETALILQDYVDPSKKTLRKLAEKVSRLAGNRYIYLVPLVVHNTPAGHMGFNRDFPFSENEKKTIQAVLNKLSSIFEREENEKSLRYSLQEKETLLKELHHRVKNNMQIISGLLSLQSFNIEDEDTRKIFIENQNRIKSIAMIHEQLYSSGDFLNIDFTDYLNLLSQEIKNSCLDSLKNITIDIHADKIFMDIEKAIPCALITGELLTSALGHTFQGDDPRIVLDLTQKQNEEIILTISDNGQSSDGTPFSPGESSLGYKLVKDLTKQLKGSISFDSGKENRISLSFNRKEKSPHKNETEEKNTEKKKATSVLIVEDDIITASYIKRQLEKEGYQVPATISTGEEAVAFCDMNTPDIVLMDLQLAGEMDGIEAARRIKAKHDISLLYASGNAEDFSLVKAQKTSPLGFIVKPIKINDLLILLRGIS